MWLCVAVLAYAAGFHSPRLVTCKEVLQDGRQLLSMTYNGVEQRCKYSPPKGQYEVSAEELRRMARAKERMTKIGHSNPEGKGNPSSRKKGD